jgi:hypothetical protein
LHVKLGPGGLREIHLLWLVLEIFAELPAPFSSPFLSAVVRALPEQSADLRFLLVAHSELRRVRDLYRLVVAMDEPLEINSFEKIAKDLAPIRDAGAREGLGDAITKLMGAAALRVDRILRTIQRATGGTQDAPGVGSS